MKLPLQISPMLAIAAEPFNSPDYLFEIKWDGLRCLAFLTDTTRLQSRNLRDISFQYPELTTLHQKVHKTNTILDGEIIVLEAGKPSFFRLQSRMHATSEQSIKYGMRKHPVIYMVFDLLYSEGKSLMHLPLYERQELLYSILIPNQHLVISQAIPEQGLSLYSQAVKLGLEGIIGKEKNSPYLPGKRSPAWQKSRITKSANFVICGYTTNPKGREDLSALIIGAYTGQDLLPYGLVGTGFSQAEIDYLLNLFKPLLINKSCLTKPLYPPSHRVQWLRPQFVCEVEYLEVTGDHHLRHPLYKGLRKIEAKECQIDLIK